MYSNYYMPILKITFFCKHYGKSEIQSGVFFSLTETNLRGCLFFSVLLFVFSINTHVYNNILICVGELIINVSYRIEWSNFVYTNTRLSNHVSRLESREQQNFYSPISMRVCLEEKHRWIYTKRCALLLTQNNQSGGRAGRRAGCGWLPFRCAHYYKQQNWSEENFAGRLLILCTRANNEYKREFIFLH